MCRKRRPNPPSAPVAQGDSASPAAVSDAPAATNEKHSWFPTRWLGLGKTRAATQSPHIVHVDVDAFFASVEQVLNPKLRGKPVLVGRGVVASASYEAKFRGVKTAMSFRDALRLCPKAIVVPGQYDHYADFAERVRRILETYTPAVEIAALDDFYLDFAGTERLYPDYEATLRRVQAEILGKTGLSVSVGAARTKAVASIASRLERSRGFRIVNPGEEELFLAPLPVEKLHGIGHTHAAALAERGVATIGQLRLIPKPVLIAAFGEAVGQQIWERARGLDGREVLLPSTPKSVSRETTIEGGTIDTEFLGGLLEYLSERIGGTLREYGKQAHTLGVRLRYVDHFSAHQTLRLDAPRMTSANSSSPLATFSPSSSRAAWPFAMSASASPISKPTAARTNCSIPTPIAAGISIVKSIASAAATAGTPSTTAKASNSANTTPPNQPASSSPRRVCRDSYSSL